MIHPAATPAGSAGPCTSPDGPGFSHARAPILHRPSAENSNHQNQEFGADLPMQLSSEINSSSRIDLPPLPIYSLLCGADVNRALLCFDTLYRRCRDRFRLTVLDDGSLTASDRDRLLERFGEMKIISEEEREDLVAPRLRGKPNCLRYRKEHVFSLKLVDGPLLDTGAFALCDSDIYFVHDFDGIDRRASATDDLAFMQDWCNGYAISFSRRVLGRRPLRLPERLNAGILYVGPRTYDLDFIEWFLGVVPRRCRPPRCRDQARDLPDRADGLGGPGRARPIFLLRPGAGRLRDEGTVSLQSPRSPPFRPGPSGAPRRFVVRGGSGRAVEDPWRGGGPT